MQKIRIVCINIIAIHYLLFSNPLKDIFPYGYSSIHFEKNEKSIK